MAPRSPVSAFSNWPGLAASVQAQPSSPFFGRLPPEIRELVYSQIWVAGRSRQHVRLDGSRLIYSACVQEPNEVDQRNEAVDKLWLQQGSNCRRSWAADSEWVDRLSSSWNEHWRCEEHFMDSCDSECANKTLFFHPLLSCKQFLIEALPFLYASTTFIFTDLPTAHHVLVSNPSPSTQLMQSVSLSLSLTLLTLQHNRHDSCSPFTPDTHWAQVCTSLSDLVRFSSLREATLRLDLEDDDYWWKVRERWALGAIRGMLAKRLTVQLPELTTLAPGMKNYQYWQDDVVPFKLERYDRLRWTGMEGQGVEARLEFFTPRTRPAPVEQREGPLRRMKTGMKRMAISHRTD